PSPYLPPARLSRSESRAGGPLLLLAVVGALAGCVSNPEDGGGAPGRDRTPDEVYGKALGFAYDGVYTGDPEVVAILARAGTARSEAVRKVADRIGLDGRRAGEVVVRAADASDWREPPLRFEEKILEGRRRPLATVSMNALVVGITDLDATMVEAMAVGQVMALRGDEFHRLPPWFRSGLALYASGRGEKVVNSRLAELLAGALAPAYLVRGLDVESPGGWDLAGYLAFLHIEAEYGAAGVKEFARVVVEDGVEANNACAVALGLSPGQFRARFLDAATRELEARAAPVLPDFRRALALEKAGAEEEAAALWTEIATRDPEGYAAGDSWYRAGRIRLRQGRHVDALEAFDRVVSAHAAISPHLDQAAYGAALAVFKEGDPAGAMLRLRQFIKNFAGSGREPRARSLLGQALASIGDLDGARSEYLALRERFPADEDRHKTALALARISLERHEYGIARTELALAASEGADPETAAAAREGTEAIDAIEAGDPPPELAEELQALAGELAASGEPLRLAGVRARLLAIGPLALSPLVLALENAGPGPSARILETLAALGDRRAARHLIERLRASDVEVQVAALSGLLVLGLDPDHLAALAGAAVRDASEEKKVELAARMAELFFHSTPELRASVPRLVERLRNPDSRSRLSVLVDMNRIATGAAGAPDAVPVLSHLLRDPDPEVRHKALVAANLWGDVRVADGLAACLASTEAEDRALALHLLGRFDAAAAVSAARAALSDDSLPVRVAAVQTLGEVVRARAGGQEGLREAVAPLVDAALASDERMSGPAHDALLAAEREWVVEELAGRLREPELPSQEAAALFRLLERVTGAPVEFETGGSSEDRARALQAFDEWWQANREPEEGDAEGGNE
ncbi:MAG: tetratricopeptide repeat protein, partial [Planctomycetes bacterium]|nr:tetratricopeptide repeat protein [Planctomycetota bacterium]